MLFIHFVGGKLSPNGIISGSDQVWVISDPGGIRPGRDGSR